MKDMAAFISDSIPFSPGFILLKQRADNQLANPAQRRSAERR
jgi:hypothetical protein